MKIDYDWWGFDNGDKGGEETLFVCASIQGIIIRTYSLNHYDAALVALDCICQ